MKHHFVPILLAILFVLSIHLASSRQTQDGSTSGRSIAKYLPVFAPYRYPICGLLFDFNNTHRQVMKDWLRNAMKDTKIVRPEPMAEVITCDVCLTAYPIIVENLETSTPEEVIVGLINLCVALEIASEDTCTVAIRGYAPPIFYIIENRPDRTMEDLCGILNPGCTPVNETLTNWQIFIDPFKPPVQTLPPLPEDTPVVKILQFTDVHVDLDYLIGSDAGCDEQLAYLGTLCCRSGEPSLPENAAGPYGDHRCSLAPLAYDAVLEHAKEMHGEAKYIFLTGDFMHNGMEFYSQTENSRAIQHVTEKLVAAFPSTPIYPLSGNHDSDVQNMYPPTELWDEFDIAWLYTNISAPFGSWLGPDQLTTFHKGGYYFVTPEPGLGLVVLNTNLCYLNNFWIAYDTIDPEGQLQWLADTMLQAEKDGLNVYILGHIPPGSRDCWPVWSDRFDRIVHRFENIIRAQFYGHEHTEYFNLAFEPVGQIRVVANHIKLNPSQIEHIDWESWEGTDRPAAGVTYVAPSTLADVGRSSAYKVYHVDGVREGSSWEILEHETWILNTTSSNEADEPIFQKIITFKQDFGLESMRGQDLYNFVLKMLDDDELYIEFQRHVNKGFTMGGPYEFACDPMDPDFQQCKINLLCICLKAYSGNTYNCQVLEEKKLL